VKRKTSGALLAAILVLCLGTFGEAGMSSEEFIELCGRGTPSEIRAAIESGADVNAADEVGLSPLYIAAEKNLNAEVIKILLKAGADVNARSMGGKKGERNYLGGLSPLHGAARNSNIEVTVLLLKAGADVKARSEIGFTPLAFAASNPNPEVVKVLLKAGSDVNARIESGTTPLHFAAVSNPNLEVFKALLEAGAEVNARTREDTGFTPLHWASEKNSNPEVVTYLLQAGADWTVRTRLGLSPLDYVRKNIKLKDTDAHRILEEAETGSLFDTFFALCGKGSAREVRAAINLDSRTHLTSTPGKPQ